MRPIAIGLVVATIGVLLFSIVAGSVLSQRRVVSVLREALAHNDLPYATETNDDYLTQCALLQMQYFASGSPIERALASRIIEPPVAICDNLKLLGKDDGFTTYVLYHHAYGARFLDAPFLALLSFRSTGACYRVMSYGAIVLLFVAMLLRQWRMALTLSPIPILLLYAFGLQVFGKNLAHAPSFFVGILVITLFLAIPKWFGEAWRRYLFYGVLAVVCAYFDLLTGAIPFLFGLTLIVSYFFYLRPEGQSDGALTVAFREAAVVGLSFVLGYILLTVVRLGLLATLGFSGASGFLSGLSFRLSTTSDNGTLATIPDVIKLLWSARFQLTPGGAAQRAGFCYFGLGAWLFAGVGTLAVSFQRRPARLLGDVFVLGLAGGGIVLWYLILLGPYLSTFSLRRAAGRADLRLRPRSSAAYNRSPCWGSSRPDRGDSDRSGVAYCGRGNNWTLLECRPWCDYPLGPLFRHAERPRRLRTFGTSSGWARGWPCRIQLPALAPAVGRRRVRE